jgi:hypothetical protein
MVPPGPKLDEARALIDAAAVEAGRDPSTIGFEGRVTWADGGVALVAKHADRWRRAGATHMSVNTMGAGFSSLDAHLDALAQAAEVLELARP